MAKNVFRAGEVRVVDGRVYIQGPEGLQQPQPADVEEAAEEAPDVEEYTGPTAEELRREAEEFKQNWETERQKMIDEAKQEADRIVKEAENRAFEEVQSKNEQAQSVKQEAEQEKERILSEAREEAERMTQEARSQAENDREEARRQGYEEGREEGFQEGKTEAERLIDRLHVIINHAIERRNEIIQESEAQLIELVLQIAKKVVKVISENQKNVVVNNVVQALRKLKAKSDVIVRVNFQDVRMTSEHTRDIIRMVEQVGNITVAEDSSVDPGGCIIETDFGQIDARISSQLREIEDRIVELTPIKATRQRNGQRNNAGRVGSGSGSAGTERSGSSSVSGSTGTRGHAARGGQSGGQSGAAESGSRQGEGEPQPAPESSGG